MRRIKEQGGQTIAIAMMVTMLMLLLSAAVVTTVIQNMRDASQSKSQSMLYSAAEVGLGMAQREINRASYYMIGTIWTSLYINGATESQKGFSVVDAAGFPYKFYDYFKDLQKWPGFSVNDGWFPLKNSNEFDKFYHFAENPNSSTMADEIIGEDANDDSLTWGKQRFVTRVMRKGVDFSKEPDNKTYRYYQTRPPEANASASFGWYNDLLPLSYAPAPDYGTTGEDKSLILKKLYTFQGEKPPIRVAVYVRLNLEDYVKGNSLCPHNPRHDVTDDPSSPNYVGRCSSNLVKFLVAAVSEATPEAPSQFSSLNMAVEMGGAIKTDIVKLIEPIKDASGSDDYKYDPGCFAPVLSPLVGASDSGKVGAKGAVVSGMVFSAASTASLDDPDLNKRHWWPNGRVFLYEQPYVDGIFKDVAGLGPDGLSKNTIFLVGYDPLTKTYRRYHIDGPKPPASINANTPSGIFFYDYIASKSLVDKAADPDNASLLKDIPTINFLDQVNHAHVRIGYNEKDDQTNNIADNLWFIRHASGYYNSSGRFYIQRLNDYNNPLSGYVGFVPQATGFVYFASAHYLATGDMMVPIPYRVGLPASASSDQVRQ